MKRFSVILVFVLFCRPLAAQTLNVPDINYPTIQSAINDANNGDTIIVSSGQYTENINFLGRAIILKSVDPNDPAVVADTIIDGSAPNDPNIGSVVTFNSSEGPNSLLTGFTIQNGTGQTDPTVDWRLWTGDNGDGGGVLCSGSSPTITKNVFKDCQAVYGGGGIFCNNGASPLISENTFINNYAGWYGGAVFGRLNCSPTISGNIFKENQCRYLGGAVYLAVQANSKIINNYFEKNDCQVLHGGALYCFINSSLTVACNFFVDNTCSGTANNHPTGAAMLLEVGAVGEIINNLFTGNECINSDGSVIRISGGSSDVVANNIIYDNASPGLVTYGTALEVCNNNLFNNAGGNYGGTLGDQTGINGNISQQPQISELLPEPFTFLELNSDSPCIDAGTNTHLPVWLTTDYDGTDRIVNGTVDMGPQEYHAIGVPQDYGTIQQAVNAAQSGDEIIVSPDLYYENVDFLDKNIRLRSLYPLDANCVAQTVIDGNGLDSCIKIISGQDPTTAVAGLRLQNGNAPEFGGGIYVDNSSGPVLMFNYITQNFAECYGGGIDSRDNCYSYIFGNTIIDNDANDCGGGIHNGVGSTCIIENNKILNNTASLNGGAIYSFNETDIEIINNEIADNSAGGAAGIYQEDGSGIIDRNIFTGNVAASTGGAIVMLTADTIISNNLVYANRANQYAGILIWSGGTCEVRNNTIVANVATDIGGGISVQYNVIDCPITNNIVAKNDPAGIYVKPYESMPSDPNIIANDLWNNTDGNYLGDVNDMNGIDGNICADPCFVDMGSWVDVNDPNIIVEPNDPNALWLGGDYRIAYYSPCRDAGSSDNAPQIDFDQNQRPHFEGIDIGAYELQVYDLAGNGTVNLLDLEILADSWLEQGGSLPADLDDSNQVDFLDLALLGGDWHK
jgi:predicted outer membrane repeat protein